MTGSSVRGGRVFPLNEVDLKKRDPESLGDILDRMKQTSKLGGLLEKAQIWDRWPELAGSRLACHGHPVGFRPKSDRVLVIEAQGAVWMHRFAFKKWDIIRRINRMAQRELVSDIFVVLAGDDRPETSKEIPEVPPQHSR